MQIYIAMLRGINVSGKKIVKMDTLKRIFESLRFQNVKTYIQSGNVIFETPEQDPDLLREKIEKELQNALGFEVPVILRTVGELEEVIRLNPFDGTETSENEKLYITFLSKEPEIEAIQRLESHRNDEDEIRVLNREVYLLCRNGYGRSLFSNAFIEKKLRVSATTRNWETVNTLVSMARS